MKVYILQEGRSNVFKIGKTSGKVEDVIKRLQTGNSQQLSVFDEVPTNAISACEAFFHRRLRSYRVGSGGGWEFFKLPSEDEMRQVIAAFRQMFEESEAAKEAVGNLKNQESTGVLLEPTTEDQQLLESLMRNREEQEFLKFECELLESKLKQRIGTASGLRGIATWKSQVNRYFDEDLFRSRDPELYDTLLEKFHCLDKDAWQAEEPEQYKAIQTTYSRRELHGPFCRKRWLDDFAQFPAYS